MVHIPEGGILTRHRGSNVRPSTRARLGLVALLLFVSLVSVLHAPAAQAASPPASIETPVNSLAPDASAVAESYVSLYAPLPAADGPRPAACDRIGYLRFRNAGGPTNPADADAIFVAQPGVFEGAGAFDQVARNTITAAANLGYNVEFWALNRRSNCLVDNTGVAAALAAKDPNVALNYYYNGASVNGQTFAGFVSEKNAGWLSHVGVAQTVQDEYTVISQLPPAVRQKKVLCGGHSLGGILTAAFADWDFSGVGDPAAAGYNQCAGYFSLDSRLTLQLMATTTMLNGIQSGLLNGVLGAVASSQPYVNFAPISPDVLQALPILGLASYFYPNTQSTLLKAVPTDANFTRTFGILLANSWLGFLTGQPNGRNVNATNQATVGFVFGDVSQPLAFIRSSVGVPTGGPLIEKNFPVKYGSPPGSLGGGNLQIGIPPSAAPANGKGPLYSWLNYNQVTTPGPSPTNDPGNPYTSAGSEVSDITQLSRTLFDAPALFTENYFPTALLLDSLAIGDGDRSGSLAGLRYSNGITQHPAAYVDGSEGLAIQMGTGSIPQGPSPQAYAVAPGYNHLDVLTAAAVQNNGQPETSSHTLATWMSQVIGPPGS